MKDNLSDFCRALHLVDGMQSASLIAAHELAARGWGCDSIKHMAGGFLMWDEYLEMDCVEVEEEAA